MRHPFLTTLSSMARHGAAMIRDAAEPSHQALLEGFAKALGYDAYGALKRDVDAGRVPHVLLPDDHRRHPLASFDGPYGALYPAMWETADDAPEMTWGTMKAIAFSHGYEAAVVSSDALPVDHPFARHLDEACDGHVELDLTLWTPSAPPGDGWQLVGKWDHEDGPLAFFARPIRRPAGP